ncbi:MAG: hypothetical protein KGZ25_02100, partial [Planctomycetes bacterium]|nr:hypothetical protein [Planctomycetota bacterium]
SDGRDQRDSLFSVAFRDLTHKQAGVQNAHYQSTDLPTPTGAPHIRDATQMQGVIAERALPFIALKGQYMTARGDGGRRPSEPWGTGGH